MWRVCRQDAAADLTWALFQYLDVNNDNVVTAAEMHTALTGLAGGALTGEDVLAIVAEADTDGNGAIDLEEFRRMCGRHLYNTNGVSL